MKKFFMAVIALMMTANVSASFYIYLSNGEVLQADSISTVAPPPVEFKTEATVDVTVMKDGKTQAGVEVYKAVAHGDIGGSYYKQNYKDAPVKTNEAGVAHFELKSPDDFAPSSVGADETITVYFAVFDANDDCLAFEHLKVKTGEKNKPLTLNLKNPND